MSSPRKDEVRKGLAAHFIFALLPDSDLDELVGHSRFRRIAARDLLFAKGTSAEHSFLVSSGRFKIIAVGPHGNELLFSIVEPGDLTGFFTSIGAEKRFVNAIALKKSEVIVLSRRRLMPILERNPRVLIALLAFLSSNLRQSVEICQSIGLLDSQGRLWSRLMNLSQRYGRPVDHMGVLRIDHGLSQEDLASSIGVTRVMVNRTLRSWHDLGLAKVGRGYLEFLDPDRLEALIFGSSPPP